VQGSLPGIAATARGVRVKLLVTGGGGYIGSVVGALYGIQHPAEQVGGVPALVPVHANQPSSKATFTAGAPRRDASVWAWTCIRTTSCGGCPVMPLVVRWLTCVGVCRTRTRPWLLG